LGSCQLQRYDLSLIKAQRAGQHQQLIKLDQTVTDQHQQLIKLDQTVTDQHQQLIKLDHTLADQHQQMINLNQDIIDRDKQIENIIAERDAAVWNFFEIRRTSSWKVTAPLRFLGHLFKGNFNLAGNVIYALGRTIKYWLPTDMLNFITINYGRLLSVMGMMPNSSSNFAAFASIVSQRYALTNGIKAVDPLNTEKTQAWLAIDISVVTYNSSHWLINFIDSLVKLDYPKHLLSVRFVDNGSTDTTLTNLHELKSILTATGIHVEIMQAPNHGYGAGHNVAILKGSAPFCLITNVDIIFEPDALHRVVAIALADSHQIAAWELHQKPFEHPKFYDPVTGITNWNSHACVLLRRSALEQAGYYDETLFMYGEDVELSYRLRQNCFLLRYCPQAVVWHYSYESANQVKPLQYIGSTFSNLYLRLKYGNRIDIAAVPMLAMRLLLAPEVYPGSRRAVLFSLLKLARVAPKTLLSRRPSEAFFSFRSWDYELSREGAFVEQHSLPVKPPLVSIITRTYRGRESYLRQALLSVAHQTYPNIEHIIVEDGGETMRTVVAEIDKATGKSSQFIKLDKLGRSATGNAGLLASKGRWCLFLDDDDLLFSDHIEILVNTLLEKTNIVAAYSLAWEVLTQASDLDNGEYCEIDHRIPSTLRQEFDYETLLHHNFMSIQSVLFDRQLFEERGGFEEDMDALEDWVLWKKYAALGNQFTYVPKVTSMFRTPSDSDKIRQRLDAFDLAYPLALARHAANKQVITNSSC
jgi:GT2 family glycosyltransferase